MQRVVRDDEEHGDKLDNSPTHHEASEMCEFCFAKRFCKDVGPVWVAVGFQNLEISISDVVMKMMKF
jgi:hypothetical protein